MSSSVTLLPRFIVGQTVFFLSGEMSPDQHPVVIESKVAERLLTDRGWLYRVSGSKAWIEESFLRNDLTTLKRDLGNEHAEHGTLPSDNESTAGAEVDIDHLLKSHQSARFKAGDYVQIIDDMEELCEEYAIILGVCYWEGQLAYDLAILNRETGKFIEDTLPFDEDQLELSDRSDVESASPALRPRPVLTIVKH